MELLYIFFISELSHGFNLHFYLTNNIEHFFLGTGHLFYLFFFFWKCSLWDLSSTTRDQTWAPAVKVLNPKHWPAREFRFTFITRKKKVIKLRGLGEGFALSGTG